ncbi:hypothetical protein FIU97_03740 [Roseivivax sp. THAF40]|uniref:hypothetical protein n=1 Tax=unclassified Roseivivax TaxID=2639302 RepID=UPI0012686B9D|nr:MULTISPECIES: hypothetical protein [unclassified Roseivivax]QFS81880.1 hypothetical protein FIV09_03480 [Roseivivax sp. THAF197b]QFT45680.1 hypothetical protein FIU97_03740 [Roseivivax sp. THAF40]
MKRIERIIVPVFLVATLFAGPLAALAMAPEAEPGDPMLVLAWEPGRVIEQAGGRPIGPVGAPLAMMAQGDDGFSARLSAFGAWAVLDAGWLGALCVAERI